MTTTSEYSIYLNDQNPSDLSAVKKLFENNSHLFDDHILSSYGGDARYSVMSGSFKITSITADHIEYVCEVNFFAGCADQNQVFTAESSCDYDIEDCHIVFQLDETVWICD